ncbi:MAG: polyprenyl synthetase family protein [Treponema sp.]|nr:polyprenyl synthetase family protein [Treponema sp.]
MNSVFTSRLERIEAVLEKALPETANANWRAESFSWMDTSITDEHFKGLLDPCHRLVKLGGKRWRPLLLVLCAELSAQAKDAPEEAVQNAYSLCPLVEFAHTASLIHDDIEDCADTRRGEKAAHIVYGMDTAINAGSWLYFEAPVCIERLDLSAEKKNMFYTLYLMELRRLHLGQAMDILWHRTPALIPTQKEYIAMVRNKTGTLARMAVKLGIAAGGGSSEEIELAGKIAEDIGVGFQILDDVTNLTTGNPGKKRGDDIVEGKKSLPVLMHLENMPHDAERLAALFEQARNEGAESPAVEEAITLLNSSGAIDAALLCGRELIAKKSHELADFYGTSSEPAANIAELFASMQKLKA